MLLLLPLTKICRTKKYCPFRNWHSGKIWRHHLQDQYQIVCVIRASNPSIQRISITILVFKYYMESLNHHKYKWNSSHSKWTRNMPIISSTIYLNQMQITVTRNSIHYLLAKTIWSNLHLKKKHPNLRVQPLLMLMEFIFPLNWMLSAAFSIDEMTMCFKGSTCGQKRTMYKSKSDVLQKYDLFQKG